MKVFFCGVLGNKKIGVLPESKYVHFLLLSSVFSRIFYFGFYLCSLSYQYKYVPSGSAPGDKIFCLGFSIFNE